MMRAVLAACRVGNHHVWVADSFESLPPRDPARYPADAGDISFSDRYQKHDSLVRGMFLS